MKIKSTESEVEKNPPAASYDPVQKNPFGESWINQGSIEDSDVQRYMLRMAKEKSGITADRVEWLSFAISIDKMGLRHKSIYSDILKKWKAHDFSTLSNDRNTLEKLE
ncbi:DUF6241 domain-containing protein [Sporolactobacillus kofuensis]|uniref:DUF6241 domain-containing protein n=1 Tax=Sporolactobacillus kofuensis TaxID=269672 RepID=A0ABW1WJZ3_9BACL|nr:DUF6241 domain-containing protein [Sporolactobacillus kofuensis]MCO7177180.1 DUF6241 domain-containing protein [Sporolactobacillus kofuensis]